MYDHLETDPHGGAAMTDSKRKWLARVCMGLGLTGPAGCASVEANPLAVPPPPPRAASRPEVTAVRQAQHVQPVPLAAVPSGPLTLDQLLQLAQANNPILQRDAAKIESARGQVLQAGLYPNPNFDPGNPQTFAGRNTTLAAGISQEIVLNGKLRFDTAAAQQELRQAELTFEQNRLRLFADVRRQYYATLAQQQRAKTLGELRTITEAAADTGKKLEKAGETNRIDTLLLTVDLQQVQANLRQTETNLAGARKQLAAIAGVPGAESADLVGDLTTECRPDFDEELVRRYSIDGSTLIRVSRSEITRRHILLDRARAERTPNISIGPVYQFGLTPGNNAFGLNLAFPIPIWNRNQGNIRSAVANIRDAEMSLKVEQNEQLQRVADALARYRAARQQVEQYEKEILPNVRQAQKLAQEGYAKGVFDFARYLQAQRTVVESSLSYVEVLESLWAAAADVAGLLQIENLPCPPAQVGAAPKSLPAPRPLPK